MNDEPDGATVQELLDAVDKAARTGGRAAIALVQYGRVLRATVGTWRSGQICFETEFAFRACRLDEIRQAAICNERVVELHLTDPRCRYIWCESAGKLEVWKCARAAASRLQNQRYAPCWEITSQGVRSMNLAGARTWPDIQRRQLRALVAVSCACDTIFQLLFVLHDKSRRRLFSVWNIDATQRLVDPAYCPWSTLSDEIEDAIRFMIRASELLEIPAFLKLERVRRVGAGECY